MLINSIMKNFHTILLQLKAIALAAFFFPGSSLPLYAQDSYKWVDPSGSVVYGSKPPANARLVTKFKTRELSTYSSNKVLKRADGGEVELEQLHVQSEEEGEVFEEKKAKAKPPVKNFRTISSDSSTSLVSGKPDLQVDAIGRVVHCSVIIKNESGIGKHDVSIAFKFFDGTLVPASGAFTISPDGEEKYSIPDTLLPLSLSVGDLPKDEEALPLPEVIIHGSSI
jgi:hypothetical protein